MNDSSSEDNTSEDEVEENGFYQYSGMEAMMETGRYIFFFIFIKLHILTRSILKVSHCFSWIGREGERRSCWPQSSEK